MGMLFNTDGTNRILALLNVSFRGKKFKALQSTISAGLVNALRTLPSGGGIYSVAAQPLGIDDDDSSVSTNWSTWLGYLDSTPQSGHPLSYHIGNAMADALTNTNFTYIGIEFFAVPGTSLQINPLPTLDLKQGSSNKYTKIITVQTLTVDKLGSLRRAARSKPLSGRRRKSTRS
jgi:hypothetical protein